METHKIILQGGGEHARVVLDSLLTLGQKVVALFDPKYTGDLFGVPQRGVYDPEFEPQAQAVVAIGSNAVRKRVALVTKHSFTNVILLYLRNHTKRLLVLYEQNLLQHSHDRW